MTSKVKNRFDPIEFTTATNTVKNKKTSYSISITNLTLDFRKKIEPIGESKAKHHGPEIPFWGTHIAIGANNTIAI